MAQPDYEKYYVPDSSPWPIVGAVALFLIAVGAGNFVIEQTKGTSGYGGYILTAGFATLIFMLFGWFRNQIHESMSGLYSDQLGRSYRQGMAWFIFSEVMFFAAFFGALFYARMISIPWLGGSGNNAATNEVLWPAFQAMWPLVQTPGGTETEAMGWYGLPLINTVILLISSVTCHFAHVALEENKRGRLKLMLGITVLLGAIFMSLQVEEYIHAYQEMGLTLQSGVYGNTFFLLTGFHGLHVTLGAIILFIMLLRIFKGHFTPENHFAFQAGSWYWHFVDVVWVMLFFFVYIL
ncbi:MAG: cytochrome c oxidase subunit 3 [Alteromonadaceae bacterium]|uniref:cytochrome-c oxidase n=2 Tax=Paraglaciecola mesophila TaxID=197222 RepID=K6ZU27_9ALTE|nr:cytochrome c oxidase subunit 3 [Paraglaciecola mesophila]MAD16262.1 cytochrome c oxidase subunit 3 [Alteromonadaceae bacterium]MBB21081.1 cytochrome c oxidase subunit 3 [Rickettsiales bacterium]GAC26830.1 cytochrome c oxidase subunit III [Paraglaciecola mesophila KMM 241]|tara:strand:+ start:9109 stop:9990 length:882 start_codon:yes stop_codon:yes gene_type:complete|eukprot:TRINITY_DN3973_c0_g3_i2.p1 TRINITY_DN3973_c0_g3~~TRINITY_DN3973_c0_g3_i2.p1  ORF type:complete len:294 (+),score=39.93 TRINITY_DN3973_c0_g3_i2:572-1453(+)